MAQQGWHPEIIKAQIRKTGITLTELSLQAGHGESTVRQAILFHHCPAGERVIIEYLQKQPEHKDIRPYDIWPNRYDLQGNRIIGRTEQKLTGSSRAGHCQKAAGA